MANIKIFKDFHEQYFTKMKTFGNGLFIVRNLNNTENIKQSFIFSPKMNSHILFKEHQHYQEHLILHYQYNNQ